MKMKEGFLVTTGSLLGRKGQIRLAQVIKRRNVRLPFESKQNHDLRFADTARDPQLKGLFRRHGHLKVADLNVGSKVTGALGRPRVALFEDLLVVAGAVVGLRFEDPASLLVDNLGFLARTVGFALDGCVQIQERDVDGSIRKEICLCCVMDFFQDLISMHSSDAATCMSMPS